MEVNSAASISGGFSIYVENEHSSLESSDRDTQSRFLMCSDFTTKEAVPKLPDNK